MPPAQTIRVVRGDQIDQDAVGVEELFVGDVAALARLNERYSAPTVIVATVERVVAARPINGVVATQTQYRVSTFSACEALASAGALLSVVVGYVTKVSGSRYPGRRKK